MSGTRLGLGGDGIVEQGVAGATVKAAAGGFWSWATGAGETIQTLFSGEISPASTAVTALKAANVAGWAILGYDAASWLAGALACAGR